MSFTAWEGGNFCTLRGLVAAEYGTRTWLLDVGDGQLYTAIASEIEAAKIVEPVALGGTILTPPATRGVVTDIRMRFDIIDRLA